MNIKKNNLPKGEVELNIEIEINDFKKYLEKAAKSISEKKEIKGYRPGKAPYEVVEKNFGEMAIYQEAAYTAIDKTVFNILEKEKIVYLGEPKVDIVKLAPNNNFEYKIVVALIPEVTLGDFADVKIKKKEVKVDEKKVEETINNLRKMRAKEILVEREVKNGDKVEINFDIKIDNVLIENGSAKKYPFVLGEGHMLADFEKNIIGMKKTEKKKFKLTFPNDYGNKTVAGKAAEAEVELISVYELELPEMNEEFLKNLGNFKNADELKDRLKDNIKREDENKQKIDLEIKLFDELTKKCTFGDIPEVLLNSELDKMLYEYREDIERHGMKFDDYLEKMNKKLEDLRLDFSPQAMKRVKVALMNKKIAEKEKIEVSEEELKNELDKIKEHHKGDIKSIEMIDDPRYQHFVKSHLSNNKVVEFLVNKYIN